MGGARVLSFHNATGEVFTAVGTILAGCSLATTFAKIILFRLLSDLSETHPDVKIRNVVDDVHAQCLGTVDTIA